MKRPSSSSSNNHGGRRRHLGGYNSPWSDDLAEDLLHSILMRLTCSILDFFAFSGVCKSWRSVASASKSDYMSSGSRTPLIMVHDNDDCGSFRFRSVANPQVQWTKQHRIRGKHLLGFSFGYLIFLDRALRRPSLLDPLSGHTIFLPALPPSRYPTRTNLAVLSSPVGSPDCRLLCWGRSNGTTLASCPINSEPQCWREDRWPHGQTSDAIVCGGKLFAMTASPSWIVMMDLALWQTEHLALPPLPSLATERILMDLGEEVWLCDTDATTFRAYRLQLGRREWESLKNLDGSTENPASLGGREESLDRLAALLRHSSTFSTMVRTHSLCLKGRKRTVLLV